MAWNAMNRSRGMRWADLTRSRDVGWAGVGWAGAETRGVLRWVDLEPRCELM